MQRLGRNRNRYLGETIEVDAVLRDCVAAGEAHGWVIEEIHAAPKRILVLTRPGACGTQHASPLTSQAPRIYISAGIHGDEPAGPLAARQLLRENAWPAGLAIWLCPCLNPTGFALNRRENREGVDLNRQYLAPEAEEVVAHVAWLRRQPSFDLCLCLHEDWEANGFYLYELNPDSQRSLAEAIIARVSDVCPIEPAEVIEGRPAQHGIIRPSLDPNTRPQWPEAFFLIMHKARLSYTLESPSDFPLAARVAALTVGASTALSIVAERRCGSGKPPRP